MAPKSEITGGLTPVDPHSPKIQEIAAYAVHEYNKEHQKDLKLVGVISAKQQIVNGVMYYIALEAIEGDNKRKYEAKVWEQVWIPRRELVAFNPLVGVNEPIAIPN